MFSCDEKCGLNLVLLWKKIALVWLEGLKSPDGHGGLLLDFSAVLSLAEAGSDPVLPPALLP